MFSIFYKIGYIRRLCGKGFAVKNVCVCTRRSWSGAERLFQFFQNITLSIKPSGKKTRSALAQSEVGSNNMTIFHDSGSVGKSAFCKN